MKAESTGQTIGAESWSKVFDAVNDAISLTNKEGNILLCNKAMVKLTGRPYGAIIDKYCNELLSQIPHPLNLCPREIAKTSKKREIRTINLGTSWLNCIVDPILDENNAIQNFIHIITDITPLKETEEKLKLANIELDLIYNNSADGMRIIDDDFNVLKVNNRFCEISKMSRKENLKRKCYESFPGTSCGKPACTLRQILDGEERVEMKIEKVGNKGKKSPCLITGIPLKGADGIIYGGAVTYKEVWCKKN